MGGSRLASGWWRAVGSRAVLFLPLLIERCQIYFDRENTAGAQPQKRKGGKSLSPRVGRRESKSQWHRKRPVAPRVARELHGLIRAKGSIRQCIPHACTVKCNVFLASSGLSSFFPSTHRLFPDLPDDAGEPGGLAQLNSHVLWVARLREVGTGVQPGEGRRGAPV